jgi:thioredoxin 1
MTNRNKREEMSATFRSKYRRTVFLLLAVAAILGGRYTLAQDSAADSTGFAPLDQWRSAIIAGDAAALKALYSVDPAPQVMANGVHTVAEADVNFWLSLKAQDIKLQILRIRDKPGRKNIVFKAEVKLPNGHTMHVTDGLAWQRQGERWQLMGVERADEPRLAQPSDMNKNIYPADADAHADIRAAEKQAAREHKRLLLVFGANWCFDCHVLDLAFHRPDFAAAMAAYEVVHVDLGDDEKKNADVVKQFDATLEKGIPTLVVAESDGTVVMSQKNGEFEDARSLAPEALLEFLDKWKSQAQ